MAKALTLWNTEIQPDVARCPTFTIQDAVLKTLREFCEYTRCWKKQLAPIDIIAYTPSYSVSSSDGDIVGIEHVEVEQWRLDETFEKDLDKKDLDWRNKDAAIPTKFFMGSDREIRLVYTPNEASDVYYSLADLTFTAPDTIATAAGTFVTEGILTGHTITVSGSTYNDRDFKVTDVSETEITVEGGVTTEGTADVSAIIGVGVLNIWALLVPSLTATTVDDFLYDDFRDTISDGARARLFRMTGMPWANGELAGYFNNEYKKARSKAWRLNRYGRTGAVSKGLGA